MTDYRITVEAQEKLDASIAEIGALRAEESAIFDYVGCDRVREQEKDEELDRVCARARMLEDELLKAEISTMAHAAAAADILTRRVDASWGDVDVADDMEHLARAMMKMAKRAKLEAAMSEFVEAA